MKKLLITATFVVSLTPATADGLETSSLYLSDNHQDAYTASISAKIANFKDQSFALGYEKGRYNFKKVNGRNTYDMFLLSYKKQTKSMFFNMGYGLVHDIYKLNETKVKSKGNVWKFSVGTKIYANGLTFKPVFKYFALSRKSNALFATQGSTSKDVGVYIDTNRWGIYIANRRNDYDLETVKEINGKRQFGTFYSTIILNPYFRIKLSDKSNLKLSYEMLKINDLSSNAFAITWGYNF